jgi:hypothetical protein
MDFADLFEQVVWSWVSSDVAETHEVAAVGAAGDPTAAAGVVREILNEQCTSCHHDGADIRSFAGIAPIDRRLLLRIGLYVDGGRMPPRRALPPDVKRKLVQNVCTALGAEACRRAFPPVSAELEPVRSGSEVLNAVAQRTGRPVADGSAAARIFHGTGSAPDEPRADDVMAELVQILIAADHCPNDYGSSPSAMQACTRTVLDPRLLHSLAPPARARGSAP